MADELDRAIKEGRSGRVFVAAFSSNVQRLQTAIECAEQHGREVVLAGRSIWRHVAAATGLGMFRLPAERLVAPERAGDLPRERVLVLLSGTQGEPRSGLARLSLGEHRHLRVEPGDLVILTSRHIPGNEIAIARMIDNLARLGARVVHSGNRPGIHASGHAHREEQKLMIQLVRPRFFIPVHGTYQYLFDHARLAGEMGISATMLIEDGQVAIVDEDGMSRGESVAVERIHRDGLAGVNPEVLRQRRARGRWPVNVFVVLDHDLRLGRPAGHVLRRAAGGRPGGRAAGGFAPPARGDHGRTGGRAFAARRAARALSSSDAPLLRRGGRPATDRAGQPHGADREPARVVHDALQPAAEVRDAAGGTERGRGRRGTRLGRFSFFVFRSSL